MGQDLMVDLGIDVLYSTKVFRRGNIEVSMVKRGYCQKATIKQFKKGHDSTCANEEDKELISDRKDDEMYMLSTIMAAKYNPIDVKEVISKQDHLTTPKRLAIEKVLKIHLKLFQGERGNWKGAPVEIELILGVTPCTTRLFPVQQAYQKLVK